MRIRDNFCKTGAYLKVSLNGTINIITMIVIMFKCNILWNEKWFIVGLNHKEVTDAYANMKGQRE